MAGEDDNVCFVIGPIGSDGSPERKAADAIFNFMIKPIVEQHGFKPIRADMISAPGLVSRQVMQAIIDSPLVVADLTDRNPNVYYELAVRHAIRKPLVQMINGKPPLPFDVVDTRTIFFDLTDLATIEYAKGELDKQVQALLDDPKPLDNPISETLDLESYRTSDDAGQVAMGQILGALSDLRAEVRTAQSTPWFPVGSLPMEQVSTRNVHMYVLGDSAQPAPAVTIPAEFRAHMVDPQTGRNAIVDTRTFPPTGGPPTAGGAESDEDESAPG
jgi:hypothetical protein